MVITVASGLKGHGFDSRYQQSLSIDFILVEPERSQKLGLEETSVNFAVRYIYLS